MTTLKEGQRGTGTIIYYPRVSSCLTVSCICSGIIYGMHGVQIPAGDQRSIFEMVVWLKHSTENIQRNQLIIACALDVYQRDGRGIFAFCGEKATDFSELADYLGFERNSLIDGADTYGKCKLVDVGPNSPYYNSVTKSAHFTVDVSGHLQRI